MENKSEYHKFDIAQNVESLRRSLDSFKEELKRSDRATRAMRVSLEWWYYADKYGRTPWVLFWLKLYYMYKAAQCKVGGFWQYIFTITESSIKNSRL